MNEQMSAQMEQLKNVEGAIEAILYAAGYPVKYSKLAEVLGLDEHNVKTLIEHMSESFNSASSLVVTGISSPSQTTLKDAPKLP